MSNIFTEIKLITVSPVNNPYGNNAANGVLVGPGGPTGVIGRPPYGGTLFKFKQKEMFGVM